MAEQPHPAILQKIINAPNPDTPPSNLPDGTSARVVGLGAPMGEQDMNTDFSNWWPMGYTAKVRGKLLRRIVREGKVLPLVVSSCLSLLLSIYTTTTTSESGATGHRIRLRYRSSPVSDFGVAVGSARVTPDDQLAYVLPDQTMLKGQDPDDHYWIYFRTMKGEELALDCNMFTFNMCLCVQSKSYISARTAHIASLAPAWFKDRTMARNLPASDPLLTERRRFSVLRDDALRRCVEQVSIPADGHASIPNTVVFGINEFLTKVGGRPVSELDQDTCVASMIHGANVILDATVRSDAWKRYPKEPPMAIESDPGELDELED